MAEAPEDSYAKYPQYPRRLITVGRFVNWLIRWGWILLTSVLVLAWLLDWAHWRTLLAAWIAGMLLIGSLGGLYGVYGVLVTRREAMKGEAGEAGEAAEAAEDVTKPRTFSTRGRDHTNYSRGMVIFSVVVKVLSTYGWIHFAGGLLIAWLLGWADWRTLVLIGAVGVLAVGLSTGVLNAHDQTVSRREPPTEPDDKDSSEA